MRGNSAQKIRIAGTNRNMPDASKYRSQTNFRPGLAAYDYQQVASDSQLKAAGSANLMSPQEAT